MDKLLKYLQGKNKSAFARKLGFKYSQSLHAYLPRAGGKPPRKRVGAILARRIVAATGGDVTYEDLLGRPALEKQAA